jgi:hypothetical protein
MTWFDATQVAPDTGSSPIPAGNYTAVVTAAEEAPNKAGTGRNLKLEFTITGGGQDGRKVFAYLALENPSAEAVRIAQGKLSAICHAVKVLKPSGPQDLLNASLDIAVKVKPRDDKPGDFSNDIADFKARGTLTSTAPTAPPPFKPTGAPPAAAAWKPPGAR